VVTDTGDCAAVIAECGLVVPPGDAAALAAAVARLLQMPAATRRALGRAGRERVLRRFTIESMVGSYEKLYRDLVAGADARPRLATLASRSA